ncbi:hypothetical protein EON81_02915 [bacterium]|nr:MAG: hypothetical protein EON81_02915 [bacterium]
MILPSLQEIRAEECVRSLAEFSEVFWPIVEPVIPLEWNWHLDAKCDHLEAVTRYVINDADDEGERIRQLIINEPPGYAKSIFVAVLWPAWEWTFLPQMRTLFASYSKELALRDSMRRKDVIESPLYREMFRPDWEIRPDQDTKANFKNTSGGFMQSISVGSTSTGLRGDKVVADDLISVQDAHSQAARDQANRFWSITMPTRVNDPRTGAFVLIQQRVHEEDPTGESLKQGGWVHLNLPSEYDETNPCQTPIFEDPRTEPGELLFQQMFDREYLNSLKVKLGSADYSAQHQQNPTPSGGLIFKRHWWRYWHPRGMSFPPVKVKLSETETIEIPSVELPENIEEVLQSWDCTFKKKTDSDLVAGGVWGRTGPNAYLLDRVNERASFTETLTLIRGKVDKWPRTGAIYVEDKANGPAVIDTLNQEIPGLIPVEPMGSKEARAYSVTPRIESGNVFVPHPALYGWVDDYLTQHDGFPKASKDDEVDQTTQALIKMGARGWAMSDDRLAQEFWNRR